MKKMTQRLKWGREEQALGKPSLSGMCQQDNEPEHTAHRTQSTLNTIHTMHTTKHTDQTEQREHREHTNHWAQL